MSLLVVAGCTDPATPAPAAPGSTVSAPSTASAGAAVDREAALDSTVQVRADGCGPRTRLGLGTVIDERLVATAAHVVAGADRVEIVDRGGELTRADVVGFDPDQDLALLMTSDPVGVVAPVRSDAPSAGDVGLVAIVRDETELDLLDAVVTRNVTVRTTDLYGTGRVERPGFEIDASIEPGDSGTMVHFPDGVSGVVWARSLDRVDRAWAVALSPDLLDAPRSSSPVDTGPCP